MMDLVFTQSFLGNYHSYILVNTAISNPTEGQSRPPGPPPLQSNTYFICNIVEWTEK